MNLDAIRKTYPVLEKGIFLNHAATAPVSYATIEYMKSLCDEMREPLGKHFYQWLGILEETRRHIAELIHASPGEIAFTQNTSSSLSIIAGCVDFKLGDRVLVPRDEFPSNRYVWQNLKHRGVNCCFFDVDNDRSLIETLEKLDLSNVRLISISLVSYFSGKKHDLKAFGKFCRNHNILSCVDAIQAVGAIPVDLRDAEIDFLAGGGQKWLLGPIGCGYFYIRKELINQVLVPMVGWTSVKLPESFDLMELDFAPEATRFEPGLSNIAAIGGLNQSLRELGDIGWDIIYKKIAANSRFLYEQLQQISGLKLMIQDPEHLGPILSFEMPREINPKKLLAELDKKKITVTSRNNYMRVSPHFYTTPKELETFLKVLGAQIQNPRLFFPETAMEKQEGQPWMLLNGATGCLGREIARYLAEKGFNVTGVGRNEALLKELEQESRRKFATTFEPVVLDIADKRHVAEFFSKHDKKYVGLINCSGAAHAELIESLDLKQLSEMFDVNLFAPIQFMQQFILRLSDETSLGILNIVSSSGRLGYPLLGGYGASQAGLWSISESLQRELCKKKLHVTTFVCPPLHSPMQKKIGRTSLRYFKIKGNYDYAHAVEVARVAVDAFFDRKSLVINRKSRLLIILNAISPAFITRKIAKLWYER